MIAMETSRQLRPILMRFKRMADGGLVDDIEAVARHFDLSPRRHKLRGRDFVLWWPCRLGRIAGEFEIVVRMERKSDDFDELLAFPKFRVVAPYEAMLAQLTTVFGPVDPKFSKAGKGGWIEYRPAAVPGCQLVVTFDPPTKREKLATLSAGKFFWRPGVLRFPGQKPK